jgi:hypothetical protein
MLSWVGNIYWWFDFEKFLGWGGSGFQVPVSRFQVLSSTLNALTMNLFKKTTLGKVDHVALVDF